MSRRILVYAGGGWMAGEEGSALDAHLLALTERDRPRLCFVPTACGDAASAIERFEGAFRDRAETSVLTLFDRRVEDVEACLRSQHVVYDGVDRAMRAAYDAGVLLAGVSAGMNCWFEASMTDSYLAGTSRPLADGLGLLRGSACPHFDGEPMRGPSYREAVGAGFPAGLAGEDGVGLLFEDGELTDVVTDREGASAHRVSLGDRGVLEEPLPARLLG